MQQRNHLVTESGQRCHTHHAVTALANSPFIENMKRPVVREHAMDTVWENGTLRRPSAFAKARTRHQLV
jgi:hypothetical protein